LALWQWACHELLKTPGLQEVVLVVPGPYLATVTRPDFIPASIGFKTVSGGFRRQDSVLAGVEQTDPSCTVVMIHDGARPFPPPVSQTILMDASRGEGIVFGLPVVDSLRRAPLANGKHQVTEPVDRTNLWSAQTPQIAPRAMVLQALHDAEAKGVTVTDEAEALGLISVPVKFELGSKQNIKVTYPSDFDEAEDFLVRRASMVAPRRTRIGSGHDVHKLVEGRRLVLGTVTIPHSHGLLGHSDADAVVHALCDALLNAIGEEDIGTLFPDTDQSLANADSHVFLRAVMERVKASGLSVGNVSIVVLAESPKLKPYKQAMRTALAELLECKPSDVGVAAGTMEGMGPVGRGEAIEVHATVLLQDN
jgi:2-C-methyl-D-erythritol 4-phosphate cytidylyltransferase/2-C-methyl-D-erythritol 2,4-cyclodiphosphate synthase